MKTMRYRVVLGITLACPIFAVSILLFPCHPLRPAVITRFNKVENIAHVMDKKFASVIAGVLHDNGHSYIRFGKYVFVKRKLALDEDSITKFTDLAIKAARTLYPEFVTPHESYLDGGFLNRFLDEPQGPGAMEER
jgi:hypothetical protein